MEQQALQEHLNTLSDALFEISIEILDSQNRPLRSLPNAMALATGKEYCETNFRSSPIKSAQTSVMPATSKSIEEIPQYNQQLLPNSSMTSEPITNTQIAPTPPLFIPTLLKPTSVAPKPDFVATTPISPTTVTTSNSRTTPFQIQTSNTDQVCSWLQSVGVDDDCLKIIRANKLRGKTLANYSVQQLCGLGLVVGDAEIIAEEVTSHLERYREQSFHLNPSSPETKATCGSSTSFQSIFKENLFLTLKTTQFLKNKCQFEVVYHKNIPTLGVFDIDLRKFKDTLIRQKRAGNKVASIFYFAGHGRQLNGHNFLLMTDDEAAFEEQSYEIMENNAPMLGAVIDGLKRYSDLTIGILDACRQSNEKHAFKSRGCEPTGELQMTKEDFRAGCILIYPTSPGRITLDVCTLPNRQNYGFFTGCFLEVFENADGIS
ncbi:hypothetical protein Pelo_7930 [Pelomyxa schiedti]|nr:hypothetical protein Pelo_7930 [Pelomyxa schiedti]